MGLKQLISITSLTACIASNSLLAEQNAGRAADKISLASGTQKTTLIELYTSQGCSSCPPAEQYLNSLKQDAELWKTYIPVAFHVNYWDYIGWKDQFALPENTTRQRLYARVNKKKTIYTPAFFVNGQPWRRRFYDRKPDIANREVGQLKLDLHGNSLTASFSPVSTIEGTNLVLNVVIEGMGYQAHINAGEREGSQPRHDFVLLAHSQYESRDLNWKVHLPGFDQKGAKHLALVAWVSKKGDPRPIQAVGGYIGSFD